MSYYQTTARVDRITEKGEQKNAPKKDTFDEDVEYEEVN